MEKIVVSYFPFLEIAQELNKDSSKSSGNSLHYEKAFQKKYKFSGNLVVELTGRKLSEVLSEPDPNVSERARIWCDELKDGLTVHEINDAIERKKFIGVYKNPQPDGDIVIALLQGYIRLKRGSLTA